ncbi:hypothetical protein Slala02_50770 [Streptomyces lavendulae subsp. lavendulae]|nr:hypothetical protein Slala01_24650 [Streptomyces lavendulae subsp. lavendulae]GLX29257.1 hypothetical protein Slala02_50770 [Streptomyces lavendulae subsp. lavendulae]
MDQPRNTFGYVPPESVEHEGAEALAAPAPDGMESPGAAGEPAPGGLAGGWAAPARADDFPPGYWEGSPREP